MLYVLFVAKWYSQILGIHPNTHRQHLSHIYAIFGQQLNVIYDVQKRIKTAYKYMLMYTMIM